MCTVNAVRPQYARGSLRSTGITSVSSRAMVACSQSSGKGTMSFNHCLVDRACFAFTNSHRNDGSILGKFHFRTCSVVVLVGLVQESLVDIRGLSDCTVLVLYQYSTVQYLVRGSCCFHPAASMESIHLQGRLPPRDWLYFIPYLRFGTRLCEAYGIVLY